jgi:hypothetical protein
MMQAAPVCAMDPFGSDRSTVDDGAEGCDTTVSYSRYDCVTAIDAGMGRQLAARRLLAWRTDRPANYLSSIEAA